ncbi:GTP-binding protein [Sutcliffiella horikoshii]|uniref:CobW family GTP-binding protein n=1 Tax=Sutcliffiella horikoshii TaxID=79883 RepID=UPI00204018E7|nr:GTP-binding protein [Sutcliffiella horikoshii]MCM3617220.1 GTP-binding protein [Sutcliffiella horikoshii]
MNRKVEVYILSGFLGSGKTTLLTQMLQQEQKENRKVAVVMNELGKVSIDSDSVPEDTPLSELFDGCICCTIQEKLESTMQGLLMDKELDAIYIETTGAAHPVEVLDTVLSPIFADRFSGARIITLLDVLRWKDRSSLSIQVKQLIREQVKHADMLILNKTDLLSEGEVSNILFELQSINPHASTLLTTYAKIPENSWKSTKQLEKSAHQRADVKEALRLKTFVYQFSSQIDLDEFENWLRGLPDSVYRIKGYLSFEHTSGVYLFQYSYGTPLYLKELVKVALNLVIIGEDLNIDMLRQQLESLEKK